MRILSRLLGADPELPDLLQEVFIAAFAGIGQLDQAQALSAFLNQIAVNVARNHIRRCVRRRALFGVLAVAAAGARCHLDHTASEAQLAVGELLGCLPAQQRVPFELRFFAEMELTEVAAECSVSVPTIKRRLAAARHRITRLASEGARVHSQTMSST